MSFDTLIRARIKILYLVAVFIGICLVTMPFLSDAAADNYFKHILYNGKLQRFNDSTRVIYYKIDSLEQLPNWDYTQWSYIKDQLVAEAFGEWERALHGKISFRETYDPNLTDIAVHWRTGFHDSSILGLERPNVISGKYLVEADIEITLTTDGKSIDNKKVKATALHEIGHALGMNGHSPYPGDLMFYSAQSGVYKLSPRDIRTIQLIYNTTPDITNPPGVHLAQFRQAIQYYNQGVQALQKKQYPKAYQSFVKAHKLHPTDPDFALKAGYSAYSANDFINAVTYLGKASALPNKQQLEIKLSLADAMFQQAQSDLKKGNKTRAIKYMQDAQKQYSTMLKGNNLSTPMKKEVTEKKVWLDKQLLQLTKK
jgi:tetratricopeptide (TPR) repeat protein